MHSLSKQVTALFNIQFHKNLYLCKVCWFAKAAVIQGCSGHVQGRFDEDVLGTAYLPEPWRPKMISGDPDHAGRLQQLNVGYMYVRVHALSMRNPWRVQNGANLNALQRASSCQQVWHKQVKA